MILALDSCLFHFFFICHHVWMFICDIAVILIYYRDYIACSGYFRLRICVGNFLRVYTSLVATPFPHILGSEAWQGFLVLESGFQLATLTFDFQLSQEDLDLTVNLKQVIIILHYTYTIHTIDIESTWNWPSSLLISISLISWYPWFQLFF